MSKTSQQMTYLAMHCIAHIATLVYHRAKGDNMKITFQYGLFFNAMIGLIGRRPDRMVRLGDDGFYHFKYVPVDDAEAKKFAEYEVTLAQWLDIFDIVFSRSRCEFGRARIHEPGDPDVLEIVIQQTEKA